MEKRFKVSEFADLIGCTPKTVYKMIERNELVTVSERVNNRETTLIIINDKQIEDFKNQFGKLPVNEGNCEDILTYSEGNEPVKNNNNNINNSEIIDKVIDLSREYINRLSSVNEELVTYKSQVLLLEDKQKTEKESLERWQNEYYSKDAELKSLQKSKLTVIVGLITLSVMLLIALVTVSILFGLEKQKYNNNTNFTGNDTVIERQLPVSATEKNSTVPKPKKQQKKK